jgi:hypothetical protein
MVAMITEFSFGKIVVKGETYCDDIKIVNGQVISGWWRYLGIQTRYSGYRKGFSGFDEVDRIPARLS